MQKQLSSILEVITFLNNAIIPKQIKEKVNKQIEILNNLEQEKMKQMEMMKKMAQSKEQRQHSQHQLTEQQLKIASAGKCNEVFCTKDSITFLENQKLLKDATQQLTLLKDIDQGELRANLFQNKIEQLDLVYFYSQPLVKRVVDW